MLVLVHIITFGHVADGICAIAQSASYKLDNVAYSQGGQPRTSLGYKIVQDMVGCAIQGVSAGVGLKIDAGLIYALRSSAPTQTQAIPNQSWDQGQGKINAFNLDSYFSSGDGLTLTYAVTGNNKITVSIDQATHLVSFSQVQTYFGTETVTFTATDTEFNVTASNAVTLQVAGGNNPPVLDFMPDITVDECQLVAISPHATDADGNTIAYSFTAPLDANGRWQTDYTSAGTYTTTITATDSTGLKASQNVKITVRNVNRPPVITAISGIAVITGKTGILPDIKEGEVLQIMPMATDPDNETVTCVYSAPFDPSGKWLIDYDQAGLHTFTVSASDGIDTVTQAVSVKVVNVNWPPALTLSLSKYTIAPNERFMVTITAQDQDADPLIYTLKKDGSDISSGTISNTVTFDTSIAEIGNHTLSAVVQDGQGGQGTAQTVLDVYDPSVNREAIVPIMGDFNGDSLTDLGVHNSETGSWEIGLSQKGVFNAAVVWLTGFGNSKEWIPVGGDFNGDGKTDIGIYNNASGELRIALSDGNKFTVSGSWLTFSGSSYSWIPFTGNFNGDKFTDFGLYNKETGEWKVALGTGTGFGPLLTWVGNFGGADYTSLTGDFNGDGLTDICIFKKSAGEARVAFSNTRRFIPAQNVWLAHYAVGQEPLLADFNDDGLTDFGYFDRSTGKWYCALNTTVSFSDQGVWLQNFGSSSVDAGHTGDFNGDGLTDAATFSRSGEGLDKWRIQLSGKKPQDLLTEIDNGIGGKTKIVYQYASTYHNELLPFPVYVTSSVSSINTVPAGRAATYAQHFTYEGGWFDATEREFRGFRTIRVTDPVTGNYTETYFHQGRAPEDGALKGQIEKILAYDGNCRLISEADNTWDVRRSGPADGAVGFPYLKEVTQTVYEENGHSITTRNQFIYDNLGNIVEENCRGDLSLTGDEKTTETKYASAYDRGHNRPLEISLKDKDGVLVNRKTYTYDDSGNLTKEIAFLDGVNDPSTRYGYDSFGNVTTTTNALGHIVSTNYESTFHTYPETIANELGHAIRYQYDPSFGVVTHATDVNGKSTETVYDTLARVIAQKNTSGQIVTSYSYPDFNTKVSTQEGLHKTEYVDGLGRAYRSVSDGEDGVSKRQISTEFYFNQRGFKDAESLPYYLDEDPSQISFVRYSYDQRGRVTATTSDFPGTAKDASSSITYIDPLYTETTDPRGVRKGIRKDVYGNTIEITEFTQPATYKTLYEYDLKGNLTKLTDAKGTITQMRYDRLGRKISLNDPDTGITTYAYDALGNLLRQTDNKGQSIIMEYDSLSRLAAKRGESSPGALPAVLAAYEYDSAIKPNCVGRLSKALSFTGGQQAAATDYYYDTEGRATRVDKSIDAITYSTRTSYDLLGRAASIEYPDGAVVNYRYNQNSGLLQSVQGLSPQGSVPVLYAQNISHNAKGQIRSLSYGNNVTTTYDYGQDLRLSRILTKNGQQQTALQDLNYEFDLNGNITTLTDNIRSNIRSYAYDDVNRLTRAENTPDPHGGFTTFDYQYDGIGNMTRKSDVGTMTYGSAGHPSPVTSQGGIPPMPHAVMTAGSGNYTYDVNGNMVSAPGRLMTYDVENRMVKLEEPTATTFFTYDADGSRIKKTTGSNSTTYINSLFEKDSDGTVRKHVYAGSNRVATITTNTASQVQAGIHYYHPDHLGSSNVITDDTGALVQYCDYTPYGAVARDVGPYATAYKYTGKELDSTGLYFYAWRYYDPVLGRFCQPDTIIPQPYNPQSLNRYSYCENNPLNYTDPSGHWSWKKFFHSAVGALVGVVLTVCLGPAGLGMSLAMAGFIGGMAGGAITGGLEGDWRGALIGGALGGVLGAVGGWGIHTYGAGFGYGMLAAGAGYSAATGNMDSFAGGLTGGIAGTLAGNGISCAYSEQFSNFRAGEGFVTNRDLQFQNFAKIMEARHALNVNQQDSTVKVIYRPLGKDLSGNPGSTTGPRHGAIISGDLDNGKFEMGPQNHIITTSSSIDNLASWGTSKCTNNSLALGGRYIEPYDVQVNMSALRDNIALYKSTFAGKLPYSATNHNSNFAVNSVIYGAGGDVPEGSWAPGFPDSP